MSREEFKNFVKAIEHNIIIKEKFSKCKTYHELILLAKNYGFNITFEDLEYDNTASKFETWFKESTIPPLKS